MVEKIRFPEDTVLHHSKPRQDRPPLLLLHLLRLCVWMIPLQEIIYTHENNPQWIIFFGEICLTKLNLFRVTCNTNQNWGLSLSAIMGAHHDTQVTGLHMQVFPSGLPPCDTSCSRAGDLLFVGKRMMKHKHRGTWRLHNRSREWI